MNVSAQLSLYPLRQSALRPAIDALRLVLEEEGLAPQPGPMSTLVSGDVHGVFAALERGFVEVARRGDVVLVATLSNACPFEGREPV